MTERVIRLVESGRLPDTLTRWGIRRLLKRRLRAEARSVRRDPDAPERFIKELDSAPLAPAPDQPNVQHYEVPAAFFALVLGRHLKYSSCYWPEGVANLDDAEASMLALSAERAGIEDGMDILDLGCGWGSLSLWLARRYPGCRILALSNSRSQADFIRARAADLGVANIEVITADVNEVTLERRFDRVASIEMFEHMRNYRRLLEKIAGWLKPEGKLFVHIFCHRQYTYPFFVRGAGDWMAKYFFTAGLMPSQNLLPRFQDALRLEQQWRVNGSHYARSARAWIERMDERRGPVLAVLRDIYGPEAAETWFVRWRLFFMACEELFGFDGGEEWFVSHYLFARPGEGV